MGLYLCVKHHDSVGNRKRVMWLSVEDKSHKTTVQGLRAQICNHNWTRLANT